jgi:hypothetical protein
VIKNVVIFLNIYRENVVKRVREHRMGNQKWTIQRNRQHWAHKTQEGDEQSTKPKTKKVHR